MNDTGGNEPRGSGERTGYIIAGVALIVAGIWFLGGRWFGMWHQPFAPIMRMARDAGWPLLLILIGVVLLIWSRGDHSFPQPASGARLMRSRDKRMIGGVIGGLSDYLQTDVTLLRIVTAVLALAFGVWPLFIAYIVALIIVPESPPAPPAPGGYAGSVSPPPPPPPPPPSTPA